MLHLDPGCDTSLARKSSTARAASAYRVAHVIKKMDGTIGEKNTCPGAANHPPTS
jgi:hypothetical protein